MDAQQICGGHLVLRQEIVANLLGARPERIPSAPQDRKVLPADGARVRGPDASRGWIDEARVSARIQPSVPPARPVGPRLWTLAVVFAPVRQPAHDRPADVSMAIGNDAVLRRNAAARRQRECRTDIENLFHFEKRQVDCGRIVRRPAQHPLPARRIAPHDRSPDARLDDERIVPFTVHRDALDDRLHRARSIWRAIKLWRTRLRLQQHHIRGIGFAVRVGPRHIAVRAGDDRRGSGERDAAHDALPTDGA